MKPKVLTQVHVHQGSRERGKVRRWGGVSLVATLVACFSGFEAEDARHEYHEDKMVNKMWYASHVQTTYADGNFVRTFNKPWGPMIVRLQWTPELASCFNDSQKATNFSSDPNDKTDHATAKRRLRIEICKALSISRSSDVGFDLQVSERFVNSSAPCATPLRELLACKLILCTTICLVQRFFLL